MTTKQIADTAVGIVVTFVVSSLINVGFQWVIQDRGAVRIGRVVVMDGKNYVPIDISNYEDDHIGGLVFAVPASVNHSAIQSSSPLQVELVPDVAGISNQKRIKISGVEPRQITTLIVPITDQKDWGIIKAENPRQNKLHVDSSTDIQHPLISALKDGAWIAGMYALMYGLLMFWTSSKLNALKDSRTKKIEEIESELRKEADRLVEKWAKEDEEKRQQLERVMKHEEKLSKELALIRLSSARIKVLLFARLSDYSRELEFWRDTIRKILSQGAGDCKTAENVINQVTDNLKTYSTRHGVHKDFDAITAAAGMLSPLDERSNDMSLELALIEKGVGFQVSPTGAVMAESDKQTNNSTPRST